MPDATFDSEDAGPRLAVPTPPMARRVLIVDDEAALRRRLQQALAGRGYEARSCPSAEEALQTLRRTPQALVVADILLPGLDGMELLRRVRAGFPGVSVVMMTAHGSVASAVEAMRLGAADYVEKPLEPDEFLVRIEKVFEQRRLRDEAGALRQKGGECHQLGDMITRDPGMREVFATIARVAPTDVTVLVTGETGTGKELVARALHAHSPRHDQRFLALNCGALPETLLESELFGHERGAFTGAAATRPGVFEVADGGTLLLDEIGNVTPAMQVKLLRVLETREYRRVGGVETLRCNVRIVAATHVDLAQAVERGEFRQDLFYRINVVPIHLPPLRERIADIEELAKHFLGLYAPKLNPEVKGFSDAARLALRRYGWPGNVRELQHVVQRALILTDGPKIQPEVLPLRRQEGGEAAAAVLSVDHLPLHVPLSAIKAQVIEQLERAYLEKTLQHLGGNVRQTAERAGFSERAVYEKLAKYGLQSRAYRPK